MLICKEIEPREMLVCGYMKDLKNAKNPVWTSRNAWYFNNWKYHIINQVAKIFYLFEMSF